MSNILIKYLLNGFLKTILSVILIVYCFGIILNLFEEIEFFKGLNVSFFTPFLLTNFYVPSFIIQLLPFIIFVSSMWFLLKIRNNKDMLILKVFGFSNFKIFLILSLSSFLLGWLILFVFNPITSKMAKYYEITKSNYSRDIDHLITFNKNGIWIRENLDDGKRIISASKTNGNNLMDVVIFNFDKDYNLKEKIISESVNIENNEWIFTNTVILKNFDGLYKEEKINDFTIYSNYTYEKITSLFKNFDTMSLIDLILNYQKLVEIGYSKTYLNQSLHSLLSIPFFLFIMTALASILTMNTLKKSKNFKFIIIGLLICIAVYYFKDLSLALGKTNRVPLALASWIPVFSVGIFSFIGILQINEK